MVTDKALPLYTISTTNGKPYISVIDNDTLFRIQLHSYEENHGRPIFVELDKKCLPGLLEVLQKIKDANDIDMDGRC